MITDERMKIEVARWMTRWGISKARLIRRARQMGVTRARVEEVLTTGSAGWLGQWREEYRRDWQEMVQTAWLA